MTDLKAPDGFPFLIRCAACDAPIMWSVTHPVRGEHVSVSGHRTLDGGVPIEHERIAGCRCSFPDEWLYNWKVEDTRETA